MTVDGRVLSVVGAAVVAACVWTSMALSNNKRAEHTKRETTQSSVVEETYPTRHGNVVVMDIPVKGVGRATERQTCFLWQPNAGGTQSFQCPNDRSTYSVDPP